MVTSSTKGWRLQVEWKVGEQEWILVLKDQKASNPIEVAEFSITNRIGDKPAFSWWVHDVVLRHRHQIVSKIKSKYGQTTNKFGI